MRVVFALFAVIVTANVTQAQISLSTFGGTYSQNFNNLASTGTSESVPNGWNFVEVGNNANTFYTASNGSSGNTDTYSFGTSSADRALGRINDNNFESIIGASFQNNTGQAVSFKITYDGEQWRKGAGGGIPQDALTFQFSKNNIDWTTDDNLKFDAPNIGTGNPFSASALNGNDPANRETLTATVALRAEPGENFYIRWVDLNPGGREHGLAIDNFSIQTVAPVPEPYWIIALGATFLFIKKVF